MKKMFFSAAYNYQHSTITEQNAPEKLANDIRSRMLGDVEKFLYAKVSPLKINPQLEYVGGFYYEPEDERLSACENIVRAELDEIDQADVIMVSLLKYSAIATITELLYAARFPEKEIVIFCHPEITRFEVQHEYWFPIIAAQRTTQNLRIVYARNDDEILDYIGRYTVQSKRVIIEGTDGIGKTTAAKHLQELGINCLDREKNTISAIMLPSNSDEVRGQVCRQYLFDHPNDFLVFLTTRKTEEILERLERRGGFCDEFDRKAVMYNDLYIKTAQQIDLAETCKHQFAEIDITDCDEHSVVSKIVKKLFYNGFMRRIIFATNNRGKLKELRRIFPEYLVSSLEDVLPDGIYVDEDANDFLGNATKKATTIYAAIKKDPVIADDSGLMVDALGGFPGVLTHRFLGEGANDEDRNAEIIRRIAGKDRTARFICELVYYDGKNIISGHGELVGEIAKKPHGKNGFGFDSIFELEDGRTLAELTPVEKDNLSARRLAAIDLRQKLRT